MKEFKAFFHRLNSSPLTNHVPVVGCRNLQASFWFEEGSGAASHLWIFRQSSSAMK